MEMKISRLRLVVKGTVQGVCFRAFVQATAGGLGLSGAVWNRNDGQVELIAEGRTSALLTLREQVKKGPPLSHVVSVIENWEEAKGDFRGFEISYSGARR